MSILLLGKWIARIESDSEDLVCQLLRRKYCKNGVGFFQSTEEGGSQFWK